MMGWRRAAGCLGPAAAQREQGQAGQGQARAAAELIGAATAGLVLGRHRGSGPSGAFTVTFAGSRCGGRLGLGERGREAEDGEQDA